MPPDWEGAPGTEALGLTGPLGLLFPGPTPTHKSPPSAARRWRWLAAVKGSQAHLHHQPHVVREVGRLTLPRDVLLLEVSCLLVGCSRAYLS